MVDGADDAWVLRWSFTNFGFGEALRFDGLPLPRCSACAGTE
jgi:hypothetical protein